MILHIVATTLIVLPLAFVAGAWWASRDNIAPSDMDDLGDAYFDAVTGHKRVTDALAAKSARITTLTDIARNQKSIKSGRILDVLEG